MKTMTCKQLGGACDKTFEAETFEAMAELSKRHGMAMHKAQDAAHLEAMQKMGELMAAPAAMQRWFEEKKKLFAESPDI